MSKMLRKALGAFRLLPLSLFLPFFLLCDAAYAADGGGAIGSPGRALRAPPHCRDLFADCSKWIRERPGRDEGDHAVAIRMVSVKIRERDPNTYPWGHGSYGEGRLICLSGDDLTGRLRVVFNGRPEGKSEGEPWAPQGAPGAPLRYDFVRARGDIADLTLCADGRIRLVGVSWGRGVIFLEDVTCFEDGFITGILREVNGVSMVSILLRKEIIHPAKDHAFHDLPDPQASAPTGGPNAEGHAADLRALVADCLQWVRERPGQDEGAHAVGIKMSGLKLREKDPDTYPWEHGSYAEGRLGCLSGDELTGRLPVLFSDRESADGKYQFVPEKSDLTDVTIFADGRIRLVLASWGNTTLFLEDVKCYQDGLITGILKEVNGVSMVSLLLRKEIVHPGKDFITPSAPAAAAPAPPAPAPAGGAGLKVTVVEEQRRLAQTPTITVKSVDRPGETPTSAVDNPFVFSVKPGTYTVTAHVGTGPETPPKQVTVVVGSQRDPQGQPIEVTIGTGTGTLQVAVTAGGRCLPNSLPSVLFRRGNEILTPDVDFAGSSVKLQALPSLYRLCLHFAPEQVFEIPDLPIFGGETTQKTVDIPYGRLAVTATGGPYVPGSPAGSSGSPCVNIHKDGKLVIGGAGNPAKFLLLSGEYTVSDTAGAVKPKKIVLEAGQELSVELTP